MSGKFGSQFGEYIAIWIDIRQPQHDQFHHKIVIAGIRDDWIEGWGILRNDDNHPLIFVFWESGNRQTG